MSSNILGSIYATTISSEKYIVIDSQNIELSGNVIMKANHSISISNGIFNTNSIVPNVPNSASLGSTSTSWSNAYIRDLSINNNLQVTGNVKIGGILDASNIYTKNYIDNSFQNVYTKRAIDLSFQNVYTRGYIDLSYANVYTRGRIDQSFQNVHTRRQVDLSFENVYRLGQIDNSFANVYTRKQFDSSYANVYTIKQFDQSYANVYTRGYIDNSFQNVYTRTAFDQSYANVYTRSRIDNSFQNVHTKLQFDTSFQNLYTIQQFDQSFATVYTRGLIDTSFQNVHTIAQFDQSYANVYTRGYIDTSFSTANVYTKRAFDLSYANVYIKSRIDNSFANVNTKEQVDNSYNNIYIKSRIDNSFANVHTRTQFDLSYVFKRVVELSLNALPVSSGGGGSTIALTSISNDIIPSTTNTYNLGSTTRYWNNSYINNLKVSSRAYQEISGDVSWNAVNGYYGLAKDAYPGLNPLSSGVKAVQTWISRSQSGINVCWSPKLGIFASITGSAVLNSQNGVTWTSHGSGGKDICWSPQQEKFVVVGNNKVMTSVDGKSWAVGTINTGDYRQVCWSPELGIYVAVAATGTNRVMISKDGITWVPSTTSTFNTNSFLSVCWAPELRLFVAVGDGGVTIASYNGDVWFSVTTTFSYFADICWSPQLALFVAVSYGGGPRVMYSSNGTSWNSTTTGVTNDVWFACCWSPELELFVAASNGGNIMSSNNGINWINRVTGLLGMTGICWSPEIGIFVACGSSCLYTSSLKGRPPTSFNVFDSSFNSIDEFGKWTFLNVAVSGTMTAGTTNVASDDRLKHNEVVINNGLAIIDQLTPKFYQKTFTMLDAHYNGDLSGYAWFYEAGLIAQEVLQIPDLSFLVGGGDYYQETINYYDTSYILRDQSNDISSNYYDISSNYYDISSNYEISTNLIKQPYVLNYNSIFSYGVAAIKELHTKVKAQTTNSLDEQLNSLIERIETLEA